MTCLASTAYRNYRASLARGDTLFFQAMRRKEPQTYFRRAVLDHHPVRNSGVLDDDHNTVLDDEAQVIPGWPPARGPGSQS